MRREDFVRDRIVHVAVRVLHDQLELSSGMAGHPTGTLIYLEVIQLDKLACFHRFARHRVCENRSAIRTGDASKRLTSLKLAHVRHNIEQVEYVGSGCFALLRIGYDGHGISEWLQRQCT
jgi:hypothetical protein